ncbi:hypothetical protein ES703_102214 [subsurface metagenome]
MPIFGRQATADYLNMAGDTIYGSLFTCPEIGTAKSMSVYFDPTGNGGIKFKLGIYKNSDQSLIGYTGEGTSVKGVWVTKDIIWGGTLEATDYYLVVWLDEGEKLNYFMTGTSKKDTETYGESWPNPWVPVALGAYIFSIYCFYNVEVQAAGGGPAALVAAGII